MACLGIMLLQRWNVIWRRDTRAVAQFIKECMMHRAIMILALRARHQISPWWLEMAVDVSVSLSVGLSRTDGNHCTMCSVACAARMAAQLLAGSNYKASNKYSQSRQ